jgi:APA family basic amino acid/polyamine antiporter
MAGLNGITWVRLLVWLIIGLIIYFTYSVKHSLVRNPRLRANSLRSEIRSAQTPTNP